jgi:hypothetical protein
MGFIHTLGIISVYKVDFVGEGLALPEIIKKSIRHVRERAGNSGLGRKKGIMDTTIQVPNNSVKT